MGRYQGGASVPQAIIIAATIAALITAWLEPKPVEHVSAKYCAQPVWDRWGNQIGGKWILCKDLDRYEWA